MRAKSWFNFILSHFLSIYSEISSSIFLIFYFIFVPLDAWALLSLIESRPFPRKRGKHYTYIYIYIHAIQDDKERGVIAMWGYRKEGKLSKPISILTFSIQSMRGYLNVFLFFFFFFFNCPSFVPSS